jgi:hypothetical protein
MSNKVVRGIVCCRHGGSTITIETDGIHRESELVVSLPINRITLFVGKGYLESELVVSLPINRITLFVGKGYLGLFDLCARGIFYFSHTSIKYEYFVGSKTLKVIFDSNKI